MPSSPDRPPRVLMVIAHFHPVRGGAENQAFELARRLVRDGCDVTVLTLRRVGLPASERKEGIRIHRQIRVVDAGPLFGLTYLGTLLLYLLFRGWRYDILHAHQLYLGAVGLVLFARLTRKPCIAKVACSGEDGDISRLTRLRGAAFLLRGVRKLDRVVTLTRHMRQELLASGFKEPQVPIIPNGVDVERFTPAQERGPTPDRPRAAGSVVLFSGRLTAQKEWRTLLDAFARLKQTRPEATLLMLGDGPDRGALEAEARRLDLGGTVRLLGGGHDPVPYLRSADAFVLTTRSEGMSNVLLEAMASGLPCVATRIEPNEALIDHGRDGLLVPPSDAEALAAALDRVLADPTIARRLGEAARARAVACHRFERVVASYRSLYRELLAPEPGASGRSAA